MLIERANNYRTEPTPYQAQAMGQWVGACRFVYNIGLEQRIDAWRKGVRLDYNKQAKQLTTCRETADWLDFTPGHALQYALMNVEDAFARFLSGQNRFPAPRKKFKNDAFTLPAEDVEIRRLNNNHGVINLPKIGEVRFRGYRPLGGRLRSVTFRRKANKWSVSCAWDQGIPDPPKRHDEVRGIDRGVEVFAAVANADGTFKLLIDSVNAGKEIRPKLAKLQQRLARKVKFSSNWRKLKQKISRLHVRAADVRRDHAHKASTNLAKSHGHYRMEKLRVPNISASAKGDVENPGKNVAQKSGLNRSILDQRWGMFETFLSYKEAEHGGILDSTPAPNTSLNCPKPNCGHCRPDNRPSRDLFVCQGCGFTEHADIVGAMNISQGRILPVEPPKRTRKRVGKRKSVEGIKHAA
jgi:putative transposase